MNRKSDIIIHFDDGTALEHFGVPGMKWGVRKAKEAASTVRSKLSSLGKAASEKLSEMAFNKAVIKGKLGNVTIGSKAIRQIAMHEAKQSAKAFFKKFGSKTVGAAKNIAGNINDRLQKTKANFESAKAAYKVGSAMGKSFRKARKAGNVNRTMDSAMDSAMKILELRSGTYGKKRGRLN